MRGECSIWNIIDNEDLLEADIGWVCVSLKTVFRKY